MVYTQAFRLGETVRIADEVTLARLQHEYAYSLICPKSMSQYAGRIAEIEGVDCAYGYKLVGIPGHWIEDALLDLCFEAEYMQLDPVSYRPANETYRASADATERVGYVSVRDIHGTLFLLIRSHNAQCDAESINRIAARRSRLAFEILFGFDGDYGRG